LDERPDELQPARVLPLKRPRHRSMQALAPTGERSIGEAVRMRQPFSE
jgi:hypothetical protein